MAGTRLIATSSAGAAAGNSPAGAAVTPAAAGAAPVGSAFDSVLFLEAMAASVTDAGIDAGAAELGMEGAESPAEPAGDDEDNLEMDDPLAFLAGLIAIVPRAAVHAHGAAAAGAGGASVASDGVEAAAADAAAGEGEAGIPFLAGGDGDAAGSPAASKDTDAAGAAARALAAQAAAIGVDGNTDELPTSSRAADFLAHARGLSGPAADQGPNATQVTTHVRDPRWAEEFGTRVALLVNQRESVAAISLTPVDLGPVDVSVTVRDSQATIHFGAAQAETRALIEASLPRLRELLAAQGFQLMDASVSQGFSRPAKQDAPSIPRPSSVDDVTPSTTRTIETNGLLDLYA